MKKIIKFYLKKNKIIFNIFVGLIFIYLKFAYITSKWRYITTNGLDSMALDNEDGILFAIWHNKIAYGMHFFSRYKDILALVSPHSDGKIITKLIGIANHHTIQGSTNKNSTAAIKEIIKQLLLGNKIVVTPDGPRGPVNKNGSVITKIASKYNKKLIPVSCAVSKYFQLNSWDKMMIPKPFGKIILIVGAPLDLTGNDDIDKLLLENSLNDLTKRAQDELKLCS